MKYLSLDLEATGLEENDRIIELAAVPFCVKERKIETALKFHVLIKCPPFEQIRPTLNPWVVEHNEELIRKAHREGLGKEEWKGAFTAYLESKELKEYFGPEGDKKVLFGKSMNAIDLPFLNRDLGPPYMRRYFHHQILDLSSVARAMVDMKRLPPKCVKGEELTAHFGKGKVAHTALQDAINTAEIYMAILGLP